VKRLATEQFWKTMSIAIVLVDFLLVAFLALLRWMNVL